MGQSVIVGFKPVLWYVKEFRRGRTLMPDVLQPLKRGKDTPEWGKGEGGIGQIVEHLSEPGERIVDPFAGTGTWGKIVTDMGRRWLGSDIKRGGTTQVVAAAS